MLALSKHNVWSVCTPGYLVCHCGFFHKAMAFIVRLMEKLTVGSCTTHPVHT